MRRLGYDPESNTYSNHSGFGVKASGFGITCKVEYLYATLKEEPTCPPSLISYFHTFVQYFVKEGYERDLTIRAAPYDWRMTPGKHVVCSHMEHLYV